MKRKVLISLFVALFIFVGPVFVAPRAKYSEDTVIGHSNGNHRLSISEGYRSGIRETGHRTCAPCLVTENIACQPSSTIKTG